jgi:beta-glucosidase
MHDKKGFPDGFLWGAATASYQIEGGIENNDWAQSARDGKVPVCGRACDSYNRYEEDFDIAQELGHNAHRFSIEWSRIEPEEGKFDEKEIEHYRKVLQALHARNLLPAVTMLHFTLPIWFSEGGGWERKDAPDIFARYCTEIAERLGDLVTDFATMNEPMVVAGIGYMRGEWPPFGNRSLLRYVRVLRNMQRGHNKAYRAIKATKPGLQIGIVKHTVAFSGVRWWHKLQALISNIGWTRLFMAGVHKQCDWIGLNFYQHHRYGDTRKLDVTDFGWKIDPLIGTHFALKELHRYKKPIYITEAGCADATDRFRAEYITDTVRGIRAALREGVDVRGYCYWSLLDNYEWAEGFEKRFGLVEINYDTLNRTIRPSAYVYKEIIESNGTNLD